MTAAQNGADGERAHLGRANNKDVGTIERGISAAAGGTLAAFGLSRRNPAGIALALAGGWLVFRGFSGRDPIYSALGINTAKTNRGPMAVIGHKEGIKVSRAVTVNRPPEELYRFWREFENLPRIMDHVESVRTIDNTRSHWTVKAPAGRTVEWDAEIITEQENALIGWRSLPGAQIANAGSVRFTPAPGGRGTEVAVTLEYDPPLGPAGATIASLFGEEPSQQVREDLRRFKQLMETGETPSNEGPRG